MQRDLFKVILRWSLMVGMYISAVTLVTYQQAAMMEGRVTGQWQRHASMYLEDSSRPLQLAANNEQHDGYLRNQFIQTSPDAGAGYWQGNQWVDMQPSGSGYWEGGQWVSTDPSTGGTGYWEFGRWDNKGEPMNDSQLPEDPKHQGE